MTPDELDAIRKRWEAIPEGPYYWGYAYRNETERGASWVGPLNPPAAPVDAEDEEFEKEMQKKCAALPPEVAEGLRYGNDRKEKLVESCDGCPVMKPDAARFIAHSWEDIRALLAEVNRLQKETEPGPPFPGISISATDASKELLELLKRKTVPGRLEEARELLKHFVETCEWGRRQSLEWCNDDDCGAAEGEPHKPDCKWLRAKELVGK